MTQHEYRSNNWNSKYMKQTLIEVKWIIIVEDFNILLSGTDNNNRKYEYRNGKKPSSQQNLLYISNNSRVHIFKLWYNIPK